MHLPVWRRLAQQAAASRLAVLEGCEVAAAEQRAPAGGEGSSCPTWRLTVKPSELAAAQPVAATGPTTFQRAVAAAAAAAADPATSTPGAAGAAPEQGAQPAAAPPQPQLAGEQQLEAGQVWLACGQAYNAARDALLAELLRQAPTPLTGGYPWLDEETLCWPGAPVLLLGRGTLLSVGPSAGGWGGRGAAAKRGWHGAGVPWCRFDALLEMRCRCIRGSSTITCPEGS